MKFRGLIAVCLAGMLLLLAGCTDDNPKMEVPDTDTTAFVQSTGIQWISNNVSKWRQYFCACLINMESIIFARSFCFCNYVRYSINIS